MNDYTLVPYTTIDGIPTFTDSQIKGIYSQLVDDGTLYTVFYDGTVNSSDEFVELVKARHNLFYIALRGDDIFGFVILNTVEGKTARFHYTTFKKYWGSTVEQCRHVMQRLLHMRGSQGEFLFDVFIGHTPKSNRLGVRMIKRVGGEIVGEIPGLIWNAKNGVSETGIVSYFTREEDNENLHEDSI